MRKVNVSYIIPSIFRYIWILVFNFIKYGLGGVGGGWFQEGVSRLVGDGADTLFWHDAWLGAVPFCVHFRRLFELAVDKSNTVVHMFSRGWEDGGEGWRWRRQLWVWEEEMLGECIILLRNVCLQINVTDTWKWHMDTSGGYTVRSACQLLTTQDTSLVEGADALVWHKHVPLKVSIFAWRLVKNRLPTRANLVHHGTLSDAGAGCLCGCGDTETTQHLFISCDFYGTLWSQVRA